MTIDRLRDALGSLGPPPDAVELSEMLWLAHHLAPAPEPVPELGPAPAPPAPGPPEGTRPEPPRRDPVPGPREPERPRALHPPAPSPAREGGAAREILVPTAPMLTDPLGVQRALRPLKRRVPSRRLRELDEEATAAHIAETRLAHARRWLPVPVPVLAPALERWLSLALVVDTGPTMRLWRPLARELTEVLLRQGAFHDIRVTYLRGSGHVSTTPGGSPRAPATLLDPTGRQAVLVLSDCSGPHWWDGRAPAAVRRWAATGPTAILNPLPERLWRRSAAPTNPGLAHLLRPGLPNADLRFAPFDGDEPPDLPVPVLEIAPRWLSDWAYLVAGSEPRPVACATFPTAPPAAPVHREHRLPVEERVRRFLAAASPGAAELAAHAAVAVPSLPVLRLIQHRVLGRSGPSQLAEVLLSGLLRPADDHYEFVDGAREALLAALPRPEALHTRNVLNAISAEITRRAGTATETFPALLGAEDGDRLLPADGRKFAFLSPEAQTFLDRRTPPRPATDAPDLLELNKVTEPDAFPGAWERNPRRPVIGLDHKGRPLVFDPFVSGGVGSHGVVFGEPETRSALVRSIVLALAASYSPDLVGVTLGGLDFQPLGAPVDLPHFVRSGSRIAIRPATLDRLAAWLEAELDLRASLLAGETRWWHDLQRSEGVSAAALLVVLDIPLASAPETARLSFVLARAVEEGPRLGVHLLLSTGTIDRRGPWGRITERLHWRIAASPIPPPTAERLFGERDLPGVLGNGHACLAMGDGPLLPIRVAGQPSVSELTELTAQMKAHATPTVVEPDSTRQPPAVVPSRLLDLLDPPFPASWERDGGGGRAVPLGTAEDGSPVRLPLDLGRPRPHGGAIHGGSRDGRLLMLRTFVLGLALTHRPGPLRFVFADCSVGGAFIGLGSLPHVALAVHADGPDSPLMDQLATAFVDELEHRSAATAPHDTLIIVIDGVGPLLRERPLLEAALSRVAAEGPSRGMHLVLCSEESPEQAAPAVAGELAWRIETGDDGHGTLRGFRNFGHFRRAEISLDAALPLVEEMNRLGDRVPQLPWPAPARTIGFPDLLTMAGSPPLSWSDDEPESLSQPLLGRGEFGMEVRLAGFPGSGTVHGGPQAARRHMLRTILFGLALAHSPRGVSFLLADTSERAFIGLEGLPHIIEAAYTLSAHPFRAERLRSVLAFELEQRAALSRATSARLIIVVDDATVLAADPDLRELLLQIARTGAEDGVHLILSSEEEPPPEFAAAMAWAIKVDANVPYHDELRLPDGTLTHFQRAHVSSSDCAPLIAEMNRRGLDAQKAVPTLRTVSGSPDFFANEVEFRAGLAALRSDARPFVPVGVDDAGAAVGPASDAHGMVVGDAPGRRATLRDLVLGQALHRSPEELGIVLVTESRRASDPPPEELLPLSDLPHVIRPDDLAWGTPSLAAALGRWQESADPGSRLLVVVDDAVTVFTARPDLTELLERTTDDRRAVLVIGLQKFSSFLWDLLSPARWQIYLDQDGAGRGMLKAADEPPRFYRALRDDPAATTALIQRLAAHDAPSRTPSVSGPSLTVLNGHGSGDDFLDNWVAPGSPVIGVELDGRTVALDPFAERAHGLVVGDDADRREVVSSLVLALALHRSPDDQILFVGGLGEHPLGRQARFPHVEESVQGLLDFSGVLLPDFLGRITAELEERAQLLREAGAGSWTEYREQRGGRSAPLLLVVVDLSADLPSERRDLVDTLLRVAQRGANLGVCLVVSVATVSRRPEWDRLLRLLRWRIVASPLPAGVNQRALRRGRADFPEGERSAYLLRPDGSGAFRHLRPAQPSDDELDDLAARMNEHVRRPRLLNPEDEHAQADVPDMLELNLRDSALEEPALALLGVDRAGDAVGVPITPYRGQRIYGQVNGPGRARRHLMRKILLGAAVAFSPSEIVFAQLGIPARLSDQASPAPHIALAEPDWSDGAWRRFSRAVRAEFDRREALLRDSGHGSWGELRAATGETDPYLVVAVHLPDASISPLEIRALLDRTVDTSGRLGVFLLLSAPHSYGPLEAPLSWRIGAGEREAVLHDITGESALFQIVRWPRPAEFAERLDWGGRRAIPLAPPEPDPAPRLRVGSGESNGEPVLVDFDTDPHLVVVAPHGSRTARLLDAFIADVVAASGADEIFVGVLDPERRLSERDGVTYAHTPQEIRDLVMSVGQRAHDRMPAIPDSEHVAPEIPDQSGPDFYLFVADQQLLPDVLDVLDPMIGRETWSRLHLVVAREASPFGTVLGYGLERLHRIGAPAVFMAGSGGAEAELWQVTPPVGNDRAVLARDDGQRVVRLRADG
ncbi:hypothetical protein GCM10009678_32320 [Actinomadura kijaniata]|uniref:FtsK domain-containing protein n=1 Tax=Actinomadura namibiensis TaxID=182080 RepID=A0A7W3QIU8_ACTNM|nr:SAV_2336 N-terminal domain-related protein [Actinomadura namibiensis]MBA8948627.1 hypothetical protein [Actinomadura namibiensis]